MKNQSPADTGLSPYQPGVSWEVAEGVNRLVYFCFLVFLLLISMLENKIKSVSLFRLCLDLCQDLMNVFLCLFSSENIVFRS